MPTGTQLAWLTKMIPAAQASARRWGVPTSVTLAQCIVESAWGTSGLSLRYNNYFGIKASPGHDYAEFPTREVVSGRSVMEMARFARYNDAADCFADHARLLATLPRYAKAMAFRTNPLAFAVELQRGGYSTDPRYGNALGTLIQQLNLTQYDVAPDPDQPAQAKEAA